MQQIIDNFKVILIMKRMILLAGMALAMMTAAAQDNPYIVKTKGVVKPKVKVVAGGQSQAGPQKEEEEATDFLGKHFRYLSLCDWKDGMRFMVMPEKYDMLVNTFRDAATNREVSSGRLRHKVMVYNGHQDLTNGRVHINFTCEEDGHQYYYELPNGTFDDYCYGKMGVPTLAYLGDVDKAKELLLGKTVLTRTEYFREDTEYDGDGFKEVKAPKNQAVKVVAVGVGSRSFPVKIIVEDKEGRQFYQNVAMSKINSGMRDDEFIMDNTKYFFPGSFEFEGDNMAVSKDVRDYLNQTIHTKYATLMKSKGSGKVRDLKVPRFTGFIVDEITPLTDRPNYYTLSLRETESRRVYYKDVCFTEESVVGDANGDKEDYFGYIFALGDGEFRNTSLETRAAIREGRVIPGMSMEEVEMAVGEPMQKLTNSNGVLEWLYARSNSILVVNFDKNSKVTKAGARALTTKKTTSTRSRNSSRSRTRKNGTPL